MLAAHKESFILIHNAHSNFNHYWFFLFPRFALLTCSLQPTSFSFINTSFVSPFTYTPTEAQREIYLLHFAYFLHDNCYKPIHGHHLIFCSTMNAPWYLCSCFAFTYCIKYISLDAIFIPWSSSLWPFLISIYLLPLSLWLLIRPIWLPLTHTPFIMCYACDSCEIHCQRW